MYPLVISLTDEGRGQGFDPEEQKGRRAEWLPTKMLQKNRSPILGFKYLLVIKKTLKI